MSPGTAWLVAGQSSEDAAVRTEMTNPRSAISRFYYAAYSASHAILLSKRQIPPDRGNWPHEGLSENLEAVLSRGPDAMKDRDSRVFKQRLSELYDLRIEADYGPLRSVTGEAATRARRLAGPLVRLAERMVTT